MSGCTLTLTTFEALTVIVAVGYNVDTTRFQHHRRFHWTVWVQMLENNNKTDKTPWLLLSMCRVVLNNTGIKDASLSPYPRASPHLVVQINLPGDTGSLNHKLMTISAVSLLT